MKQAWPFTPDYQLRKWQLRVGAFLPLLGGIVLGVIGIFDADDSVLRGTPQAYRITLIAAVLFTGVFLFRPVLLERWYRGLYQLRIWAWFTNFHESRVTFGRTELRVDRTWRE